MDIHDWVVKYGDEWLAFRTTLLNYELKKSIINIHNS